MLWWIFEIVVSTTLAFGGLFVFFVAMVVALVGHMSGEAVRYIWWSPLVGSLGVWALLRLNAKSAVS